MKNLSKNISNDQEQIILNAIKVFGKEKQMDMAVEEAAELIQAVNKYKRKPDIDTVKSLAGEIADNQIMLKQLIEMHNLEFEVNRFIDIKIERLKNTIGI